MLFKKSCFFKDYIVSLRAQRYLYRVNREVKIALIAGLQLCIVLLNLLGTTLFVHSHILGDHRFTHSHIFSGNASEHSHNAGQIEFINRLADADFCLGETLVAVACEKVECGDIGQIRVVDIVACDIVCRSLRAPPVVA